MMASPLSTTRQSTAGRQARVDWYGFHEDLDQPRPGPGPGASGSLRRRIDRFTSWLGSTAAASCSICSRWSDSAVNKMSSAPAAATWFTSRTPCRRTRRPRWPDAGPVDPLQGRVHLGPRAPGVLVDRDVDAFGDGEVPGRAPPLRERRPHDLDLLGELGRGGRPRAEEAVTQLHRPPQRGFTGPAEPQWREGLLERLGFHRGVLQLPELAVEGHPGFGPQRLHQRDPLGEPRYVPGRVHAEGGERTAPAPGADADFDPAAAELVERTQVPGQVHRIVQGRHEHRAAQAHPLGA